MPLILVRKCYHRNLIIMATVHSYKIVHYRDYDNKLLSTHPHAVTFMLTPLQELICVRMIVLFYMETMGR